MDPLTQIFTQAQAPTGKWDGPIQAYLAGQQGARQNRQLDLQAAHLQVQQEAQRLAMQEHLLNIDIKLKQKERDAQILEGASEALDIMLEAGRSPDGLMTPSLMERTRNLGIRSPASLFTGPGQALMNNVKGSLAVQQATRDAATFKLPVKSVVADRGGNEVVTFQQPYSGMGVAPREAKLSALYDQAVEAGDEHMAGVYKTALDAEGLKQKNAATRIAQGTQRLENADTDLALKLKDSGFTASRNPDGTVTLTPEARPPTTGETTKAQGEIQANLDTLSMLNSTLQDLTLHPEAAGVRGRIYSLAEKIAGTINPNLPPDSATITEIQRSLGRAEQKMFNATREGIRTSVWELNKLSKAGSLTGLLDAPNVAKLTLINYTDLIAGNTMRRMQELHQPIPDNVLFKVSSPQELGEMNKNGIPLSKAMVQRYLAAHPEFDPVTGQPR